MRPWAQYLIAFIVLCHGFCLRPDRFDAAGTVKGWAGTLEQWAQRLAVAYRQGKAVYPYFNNDPHAVATRNALTLRSLIERLTATSVVSPLGTDR